MEAYSSGRHRIREVVEQIGLSKFYPGKLTNEDAFMLSSESLRDEQPEELHKVGMFFLYNLLSSNYLARDIELPPKNQKTAGGKQDETSRASPSPRFDTPRTPLGSRLRRIKKMLLSTEVEIKDSIHPLDILKAVFLCCDPFLQQDLATVLWKCKLSIPLVIEDEFSMVPSIYIWPLRGLDTKWTDTVNEQTCIHERDITSEPIQTCAFIRFSSTRVSKSAIVNSVMSETEKTHPFFYHRDSVGSSRNRAIYDGTVEVSWYFPKCTKEDAFEQATTLVNLRGDSRKFPKQMQVLKQLASVICIFCCSNDLEGKAISLLKELLKSGKKLLLFLSDTERDNEDTDYLNSLALELQDHDEDYEAVCIENLTRPEIVELIRVYADENKTDVLSLENHVKVLAEMKFPVDVERETLKAGIQKAKEAVELIQSVEKQKRKDTLFPVHWKLWEKWAEIDKEIYRLHKRPPKYDIDMYREEKKIQKSSIRGNQRDLIQKGISRPLETFLDVFAESSDRPEMRKAFFRQFVLRMNTLLREEMPPLNQQYAERAKAYENAPKEQKEDAKKHLDEVQIAIENSVIGVEHFLREMSQIYEALSEQSKDALKSFKYDLPSTAVDILLDGYPIEVMDGNIVAVPAIWVKALLRNLDERLKKNDGRPAKLFVISVFGSQSSGKSTLLNTMFGLKFPVRTGRCTRGVQIQLIKVTPIQEMKTDVDYILAVDTEGIKAPEFSSEFSEKQNNELAAFVIGLGDMTVINVMGENISYLQDILPITVLSFLRMESVGLHPSCRVVYQNVDVQSEERLKSQNQFLEKELNDKTEFACKVEKKPAKIFKEIITFDTANDVQYVPALLEGALPMGPVSKDYSIGVKAVKMKVLQKVGFSQSTFTDFGVHMQNLWAGIVKDDFVDDFKNTMETQARSILDTIWCQIHWGFNKCADECASDMFRRTQNCHTTDHLENVADELKKKLTSVLEKQYQVQENKLKEEFLKIPTKYEQFVQKWQTGYLSRLETLPTEFRYDLAQKARIMVNARSQRLEIEMELKKHRKQIKDYMLAYFTEERKKQKLVKPLEDQQKRLFDKKWEEWVNKLTKFTIQEYDEKDLTLDAVQTLQQAFPTHQRMVLEKFEDAVLTNCSSFTVEVERHLLPLDQGVEGQAFGGRAQKLVLNEYVAVTLDRVKTEVSKLERLAEPYRMSTFKDMLDITKRENDTSYSKLQTTIEFDVQFAITISVYTLHQLQNLQKKFQDNKSPIVVLKKEKDNFFLLFKHHMMETSRASLLASEVTEAVKNGIKEKLQHDLPGRIADDMRTVEYTSILNNKKSFLLNILKRLAEDGKLDGFISYLKSPKTTIHEWLERYVDEYCFEIRNGSTKFGSLLDIILSEQLNIYKKAVQEVHIAFREERTVLAPVLVSHLTERLSKTFITNYFTGVDFFRHADLEINNNFIRDELLNATSSIKSAITVTFQNMKKVCPVYQTMRIDVVGKLRKLVIGCTEPCPFCAEICVCGLPDHSGDHETPVHRPQGCYGYRDQHSEKLMHESCQILVASDRWFRGIGMSQFHPCNKYRDIYPTWKIPGDSNPSKATFWEWFLVNYADDLAKAYDARVADIPISWKNHQKESEIQKLQNEMLG